VRALSDLPAAAQVVIGAPEVPVGRYTLTLLDRADRALGAGYRERVLARVASRELNVRQVLHKVRIGEAEAGIVYRTDAHQAGSSVVVVSLPPELNVVASYPVAVTTRARQPELAAAFIALLQSPDGQRLLAAEGFTPVERPSP
jgi:molybdate transport system substrate-binding protein